MSKTKLCGCSRLVSEKEWVEPYGCCEDCYNELPIDWREYYRKCDRDNLVQPQED